MATAPSKQAPGTFSRNFAWGNWTPSTGLRKMYDCIRDGFGNTLNAVDDMDFRSRCGIKALEISLLPVRFYLFSKGSSIQVDELVYQAISRPHSLDFDRLVLFALNLSDVGTPVGGAQRPTVWANSFVRQKLWDHGAWRRAELDTASMDNFIANTVSAKSGGLLTKIRTNYRRLYDLTGYTATLPIINSGAETWGASALYLAWDRFILGGGSKAEAALRAYTSQEELWKLLGVDLNAFNAILTTAVTDYIDAGTVDRFRTPAAIPAVAPPPSKKSTSISSFLKKKVSPPPPLPTAAAWLNQEGSDAAVERQLRQSYGLKRDRKIAASIRLHYQHRCMFCDVRLEVGEGRFYAEAAHIKPVGSPHNGPDKTDNLLVLCPNHHLLFDAGMLRLTEKGEKLEIQSSIKADPLNGKRITPTHQIDMSCVKYHYDWHEPTGR